jgi:ferredoxin
MSAVLKQPEHNGMIYTRCAGCKAMIWRPVEYRPGNRHCETCRYLLREKLEYLNYERDSNEDQEDERD